MNNFTTLLRAGAFGLSDTSLEPMSLFKWSRLEEIAVRLGVAGYISSGVRLYKGDTLLPIGFMENEAEDVYSSADAHMFGYFKSKRFEYICDSALNESASMETLHLLKLHVALTDDVITSSLSLPGIITLGRFLRTEGDKVDFVKLEMWIHRLGLDTIASMFAALLQEIFDFEPAEFPYVHRHYTSATKHYKHLLDKALKNSTSFGTLSRLNIAMSETLCHHLATVTNRITDIEE